MVVLLFESKLIDLKVFSGGSVGTLSTAMWEIRVQPLGRENPLEEEMATQLQYFSLGNSMDKGAWWATVHGFTKSNTTK